MNDPIYRQDAIDLMQMALEDNWESDYATDRMNELSSAQPERKKGKWVEEEKGIHVTSYRCSECGRTVMDDTGYDVSADYPFCNCGADMRGGTDGK